MVFLIQCWYNYNFENSSIGGNSDAVVKHKVKCKKRKNIKGIIHTQKTKKTRNTKTKEQHQKHKTKAENINKQKRKYKIKNKNKKVIKTSK